MASNSTHFLLIFFSSLFFFHKTSAQSISKQKQILINIKNDWGNPQSLNSWNLTGDHCKFAGIHCSGDGFVNGIYLSQSNISFPIPASICDLKDLTFLYLSDNNIPGEFPIFLYNCSKLQELDISENYFVGNLPADIETMPSNLTHLVLSGNNFTGDIPHAIVRMPAIKFLDLSNNLFNGAIPVKMENLSTLETLMLAYNPFSPAKISPEIGNLTRLTHLWMSNTNLLGEIPNSFGKLVNLVHLDLAMNSLVGEIPASIWMIKPLKNLYLYANNLGGEISSTVATKGLAEIDLSMNELTGSIPEAFGELENLTILFLSDNNLSGEFPASIAQLPNLYDIRLFNNRLQGVLPPEMGKYSRLWNFEVSDNMFTGELPEHLCNGKVLTSLIVFDNQLTGELPKSLGSCKTLVNVEIQNNRFTGELSESLGSCETLINVQIQNNLFTGDLSAGFWSGVNLSFVIASQNALTGTLPETFPSNLIWLEIQNNQFYGKIPSSSGRLLAFFADNNKLSGELPASFFEISLLQQLSLGRNQISGEIPSEIGSSKHLAILNLSNNQLSGQIPVTMGSMILNTLDLSKNQLSGEIPSTLGSIHLNLSFNDLTGQIPLPLQNPDYEQSFLANPNLCASHSIFSIQKCNNRSKKLSPGLLILFSILGALFFSTVFFLCFLMIREPRQHRKAGTFASDWKLTSFQPINFDESAILNSLTDDNLVGSGGGGKVYRVSLNGDTIAVKKIHNTARLDSIMEKQFQAEVKILGSIRHENIVKLLCCISGENLKLLVYEYLQNGSLDRKLHRRLRRDAAPLDWRTRLQIAIGAAKGLCYMHHDCFPPFVHRDVKSSNILLDPEFHAKIADFGLAKNLERGGEPESVSAVAGSFGYMAPECCSLRKVNEKVDVYSFGVVLLELVTGMEAGDGGEEEYENLTDWAWRRYRENGVTVDQEIAGVSPEWVRVAELMFKIGILCTVWDPAKRPNMKEVVKMLMQLDRDRDTAV